MDIPSPPKAVAALAGNVRDLLAEVSGTLAPLWTGRAGGAEVSTSAGHDTSVLAAVRQFATVVVGAAGPFAPTSYSRARLIRQMHASGLLSTEQAHRAGVEIVDVDPESHRVPGAPR